MTSLLRSLTRVLRIGKEKYLAGYDLNKNAYYELPSRSGSKDPRHTRRTIVWKEKKDFSEYDQSSLPVQWKMWLRHTRRSPPTIQELQQDIQRIRLTQYNASILAAKDEEARLRLSQSQNPIRQLSNINSTSDSHPSSNDDDDVWAASKARIQSQDSKALNAGVSPQPNNNETSFANQFGMGLSSTDTGQGKDNNSEFSEALSRRENIRKTREIQDEYERKEAERRKWLLNRSVLEDFDPEVGEQLQEPNQIGNKDGDGFRKETRRQANVVEQVGKDRGLGNNSNRGGRPGIPSGEFVPEGWSPGIAKRG